VKQPLTLFSAALLLLSVTAAFGDPLTMQCNKASCVRSRCDEWGENCRPAGYFERTKGQYVAPHSKQVCDEFGDCHFALPSYPPNPATKAAVPVTVAPKPAVVVAVPAPVKPTAVVVSPPPAVVPK
jgi:hypothetical protein